MKGLFLILISGCFLFSCKKPRVNNYPGKWKWIETAGGITGGVAAKPSADSVVTLNLNSDFSYQAYLNDHQVTEGKYSFTMMQNKDTVIHFDKYVQVGNLLIYGNKSYSTFNNMLFISDYQISDGYTIRFDKNH